MTKSELEYVQELCAIKHVIFSDYSRNNMDVLPRLVDSNLFARPELQTVELYSDFSNALHIEPVFEQLSGTEGLKRLKIRAEQVSRSWSTPLPSLESFFTAKADQDIEKICTNAPNLRELSLTGHSVSTSDLHAIASLPHLQVLRIPNSKASDYTALKQCKHLQFLDVFHTQWTYKTAEQILSLPHLQVLNYSNRAHNFPSDTSTAQAIQNLLSNAKMKRISWYDFNFDALLNKPLPIVEHA